MVVAPMPVTQRGFVLHTNMSLEAGKPMMWLYARAEDGSTFAVRDSRFRPYFFVKATDAAAVIGRPSVQLVNTTLRTMQGEPVVRVESTRGQLLRQLEADLAKRGIVSFEADLKPANRYLIDRGIRGGIEVKGPSRRGPDWLRVDRVFDDPEIGPCDSSAVPSVLSFDLETTQNADQIWSVALHGLGPDLVLVHGHENVGGAEHTELCSDERALIRRFVEEVQRRDPDVLTGWNVIDFDLEVLLARAQALRVPLAIGRDANLPTVQKSQGYFASSRATVAGRVVLDGMHLVRSAFIPMEELSLDFVANKVLGAGKSLHGMHEIEAMYRHDLKAFAHYNLLDAQLVTGIINKLQLLPLAQRRSKLTGMPLDRVASSIASFDSLYLDALHQRGHVAPSMAEGAEEATTLGGLVLEPVVGLHRNVFVFDYKSLYPSLMRTFHIDPLAHAQAKEGDIEAPNGALFSREPALLPAILDQLWAQRDLAKKQRDETASYAIKILMNSLYGVLGSPSCRFFDPAVANAITGFGRHMLAWTRDYFVARGDRVLYGDTDSVFVQPANATGAREEVLALGATLVAELNAAMHEYVRTTWKTESKLELEQDTLYDQIVFAATRQQLSDEDAGARKRYVGWSDGEIVFTGMEVVRRDWTDFAKSVQRELYRRLFCKEPIADFLREEARALRAGERDHLLVYRKALRKPLDSYTASTPPHVAAARKSTQPTSRLIAYVVTNDGPELASEQRHAVDREHYIEKQLRPIAEPVLGLTGDDFDELCAARLQLRLFK